MTGFGIMILPGIYYLVLSLYVDHVFYSLLGLGSYYSRTPLIRPPSESHWCGRIRGMVAREGFI